MSHGPPNQDDQRWQAYADAHGRGDFLEPGERKFFETYQPEDDALAVEQHMYDQLRAMGRLNDDGLDEERIVDGALAKWAGTMGMPSSRRNRWWWGAATGGLTAAASIALFVWAFAGDHPSDPPAKPTMPAIALAAPPSSAPESPGSQQIANPSDPSSAPTPANRGTWTTEDNRTPAALTPGSTVQVSTHETCLRRSDGARACLQPGAQAQVSEGGGLEVLAGTARIDASVTTFEVRVAGTSIRIEDGAIEVRVEHDRWALDVRSGTVELVDGKGAHSRLGAGDQLMRGGRASAHRPPPSGARDRKAVDPAEALAQARKLRRAGDYAAAADVLHAVASNPSSGAATTAHLLLGQLYLGPLQDPRRALEHFEHHLDKGGSLAPEALYGQIKALERLGRPQDAGRIAQRLRVEYPDSSYVDALSQPQQP